MLPFSRFPGSDPVLGPEMRSTGEVMASAADLPTAFAKAERAAGRPLPTAGTAFLSVRRRRQGRDRAGRRGARGARLPAARDWRHRGGADGGRARGRRRSTKGDAVVDAIRAGRCDLVVNTPQGSGARRDGALIRQAALSARVPVHHDPRRRPARRRCDRATRARRSRAPCRSGSSMRRELRSVTAAEPIGPYTLLRVERGGLERGDSRASSSCSRRRGGCCRGR